MELAYPSHLAEPIRAEIAISYCQHEFRKLLRHVPPENWPIIDQDIAEWIHSPELATPRDFWNGFHGICMGFKLKIGLLYAVTAANITWQKKSVSVEDLWFGVELPPTKIVEPGKLSAAAVKAFYAQPHNQELKTAQLAETFQHSTGTAPRDHYPIIVVTKPQNGQMTSAVFDGNRRLIKAILQDQPTIEIYLGTLTTGDKPENFWVPTSLLMEELYFAETAYNEKNQPLFQAHLTVLQDYLDHSESARYELPERALTPREPFRSEVLQVLK